jgi:GPH family glycoside/pentoside/hexuronide:cation symporter
MAERNSISSYRFVAVMIAQFIIQVLLYPLVLIVGNGDKAVGFEKTMTVFAIVGAIFLLITFLTTRERIVPKPDQKSTVREDLLDLSKNIPWIVMLVVTILIFVNLSLKGGMYIYYFDNYVDEVALSGFLEGIGFNNMIAGLNRAC